jgi:hypothetical protein
MPGDGGPEDLARRLLLVAWSTRPYCLDEDFYLRLHRHLAALDQAIGDADAWERWLTMESYRLLDALGLPGESVSGWDWRA